MKRSCATCLWWPTDRNYRVCRNPDAYGSDPNDPEYWCAKWEPRDRSLVRCETCEWCEIQDFDDMTRQEFACRLEPVERSTDPDYYCSHWRLREERDDG